MEEETDARGEGEAALLAGVATGPGVGTGEGLGRGGATGEERSCVPYHL